MRGITNHRLRHPGGSPYFSCTWPYNCSPSFPSTCSVRSSPTPKINVHNLTFGVELGSGHRGMLKRCNADGLQDWSFARNTLLIIHSFDSYLFVIHSLYYMIYDLSIYSVSLILIGYYIRILRTLKLLTYILIVLHFRVVTDFSRQPTWRLVRYSLQQWVAISAVMAFCMLGPRCTARHCQRL